MNRLDTLMRSGDLSSEQGCFMDSLPGRWLYQPVNLDLLAQLEVLADDRYMIVNTTLARDGSGPLLASFLSTLLIEQSHANSMDGLGVCSGSVSVTYYNRVYFEGFERPRILRLVDNFCHLVFWSAGHLITPQQAPEKHPTMPRFLERR